MLCKQCDVGFHYRKFLGWRLASLQMKRGATRRRPYRYPFFEEYVRMKKRKAADPKAGPARLADNTTKKFASYNTLIEYLTCTRYDDGEVRETGWITIGTQGSRWRATLKDPDAAASISCTAPTIDEALMGLEMLASNPETPWEPDSYLRKRRRGK